MKKRNGQRENGMLTVEAILALVPFILVILGIISFINIFMVHNKIQYAIFQAGNELSAYTYLYQALGIRDADLKLKQDADEATEELDSTIEQVKDVLTKIEETKDSAESTGSNGVSGVVDDVNKVVENTQATVESGKELVNKVQGLLAEPQKLINGLIYLGTEKAEAALKEYLLGLLAGGLVEVYLDQSFSTSNTMSADEYLKAFGVKEGVKGLKYDNSQLFQDEQYQMIDIVVEYDIEIYFFKLFLEDPTVHIVQRCAIPAWLDGDGVTYEEN